MDKKLIFELNNHKVYYVKTDVINFYITIPNHVDKTNICVEIKSKNSNYDLETNDEIWVLENVKNTFSYIDDYNITLVLPVFKEEEVAILEKIDDSLYINIDKILASVINQAYLLLKENKQEVAPQVFLVNNDRYQTFINWFATRYKERITCQNLLDIIQMFNAQATSYKKLETPVINFVVGSYNTEVDAPKALPKQTEAKSIPAPELKPQYSSGFSSYLLLTVITIVVGAIVAFIAFNYK